MCGHKNWIRSGVISGDVRIIATGSDDKSIKLWDLPSHSLVNTYTHHDDVVSQVLFNPDSTCVVSASFDKKIKVTDLRAARLVQHYNAHDA